MIIKVSYTRPGNPPERMTVIGDEESIFDVWFRLVASTADEDSLAQDIWITDLDGNPIDPTDLGPALQRRREKQWADEKLANS
jgi:hypothetical protein